MDKLTYIFIGDKMKVKIFDFEDEKDLENEINTFLGELEGEVVDIKYQVSVGVFSEEQVFCFSAMIVYYWFFVGGYIAKVNWNADSLPVVSILDDFVEENEYLNTNREFIDSFYAIFLNDRMEIYDHFGMSMLELMCLDEADIRGDLLEKLWKCLARIGTIFIV